MFLADHPFRHVMTLCHRLSRRDGQHRRVRNLIPDEDFVEFDTDVLPPYCTIDRELSVKRGRTILKWTYET